MSEKKEVFGDRRTAKEVFLCHIYFQSTYLWATEKNVLHSWLGHFYLIFTFTEHKKFHHRVDIKACDRLTPSS